MMSPSTSADRTLPGISDRWVPFVAIALGALLVYVAGFAQADLVHDAAHDARHAAALPCH